MVLRREQTELDEPSGGVEHLVPRLAEALAQLIGDCGRRATSAERDQRLAGRGAQLVARAPEQVVDRPARGPFRMRRDEPQGGMRKADASAFTPYPSR